VNISVSWQFSAVMYLSKSGFRFSVMQKSSFGL
jgi:hypothetical protein